MLALLTQTEITSNKTKGLTKTECDELCAAKNAMKAKSIAAAARLTCKDLGIIPDKDRYNNSYVSHDKDETGCDFDINKEQFFNEGERHFYGSSLILDNLCPKCMQTPCI